MHFFQKFWLFILWPLYFLQQENYDLGRFWQAIPASLLPKKARQTLVWTKKLILIFGLSLVLFTIFLNLFLKWLTGNDLEIIIFSRRNFGNGPATWLDWLWYWLLLILIILPFSLILFPIFQSLMYTLVVLLIWPIDIFCKNQITKKAAKKVQKWRQNQLG